VIGTILRIRYEITGLLNEGPVFTAYSARDRLLARDVTVRVFKAPFDEEPAFVAAVERCIEKSKRLQHPGIEVMQNVDDHDGLPFIVSELSRGTTLVERIRKLAPFSVPVAIGMVISLLEALDAVHSAGLVHGDIGPHNVAIQTDGSARLQLTGMWEAYSASATAGSAVLTLMAPYMAPEISSGGLPTPASDVYGVGVILYQLLTARLPYMAETPGAMAQKHAGEYAATLRSMNPGIPVVLDELQKMAISKAPTQRYASAAPLLSDLRMIQDALRFGKSLSWPLSGAQPGVREVRNVAPKMSAVRPAARARKEVVRDREEPIEKPLPDVPLILRITLWLLGLAFTGMVVGFVWWSLDRPRTTTVPNLKNRSLVEAESELASRDLYQGVTTHVLSETVPRDHVINQAPPPDSKVNVGSAISIVVSKGSRFAEIPDLIGHTVDEARAMLADVGLELDGDIEDAQSASMEKGRIIGQFPDKKTKVDLDSTVRVKISDGPPPGAEPAPPPPDTLPEEQSTKYHLHLILDDLTKTTKVRIDMEDDYGTSTIYEETRQPSDVIDLTKEGHGAKATFTVYYDGVEVLEQTKEAEDAK